MKIVLNKLKTPTCDDQVSAVTERVVASFRPTFEGEQWPGDLDHCGEWTVLDEMNKLGLIDMTVQDRKLLSAHLWAIFVVTQPKVSIRFRVQSVFEWTRYATANFDDVVMFSKQMAKATIG